MNKQLFKYAFLIWFGGSFYVTLEVFYRQKSHWSMFLLAGIVFVLIGLLNEIWDWDTNLFLQIFTGTFIATIGEFVTGCIVNLWLGWNIWDYSNLYGNILGQITPQFILLWIPISFIAIVVDDIIRWQFFGEDKPRYTL